MKKIIPSILFVACIIIFTGCNANYNDDSTPRLEINGKKFLLEVAESDNKKSVGLGNRDSLNADRGMLFLFGNSDYLQFWMKDTLIPLQIIFVDDCRIVDIQDMAVEKDPQNPAIIYRSKEPADKAIEVNPNSFVKEIIGQKIGRLCR